MNENSKREMILLLDEMRQSAKKVYNEALLDGDYVGLHRSWQLDAQIGMILETILETDASISESKDIMNEQNAWGQ